MLTCPSGSQDHGRVLEQWTGTTSFFQDIIPQRGHRTRQQGQMSHVDPLTFDLWLLTAGSLSSKIRYVRVSSSDALTSQDILLLSSAPCACQTFICIQIRMIKSDIHLAGEYTLFDYLYTTSWLKGPKGQMSLRTLSSTLLWDFFPIFFSCVFCTNRMWRVKEMWFCDSKEQHFIS